MSPTRQHSSRKENERFHLLQVGVLQHEHHSYIVNSQALIEHAIDHTISNKFLGYVQFSFMSYKTQVRSYKIIVACFIISSNFRNLLLRKGILQEVNPPPKIRQKNMMVQNAFLFFKEFRVFHCFMLIKGWSKPIRCG